MGTELRVADVALDPRSAGAAKRYTYLADESAKVGQARFVALGARRVLGFVIAVRQVDEESLGFSPDLLKLLGPEVAGLDLPAVCMELVQETAKQTLAPVEAALGLAVPPGVQGRLRTIYTPNTAANETKELAAAQREVLSILAKSGEIVESATKKIPKGVRSSLLALVRRGLVTRTVAMSVIDESNQGDEKLRLNPDSDKVETFLSGPGRGRPAQSVTLMRLQGSEASSFSVQEVKSLGGVTDQTIKALIAAGMLEKAPAMAQSAMPAPTPNEHQAKAIDSLVEAVRAKSPATFLLFGVTGSGKTEVYLRAAEEALRRGRQVLYLVPEIALTAQVIAQLRDRFGPGVAVMHSNMPAQERLRSWAKVKSRECPVVLGARSALFAPLEDVGLVIVDEEHEASYKQESFPRYHARGLAEWLGHRHGAPVVLGSATPGIETMFRALRKEIKLLQLPERAASAKLPTVHVQDLTALYRDRVPAILSPLLLNEMEATLAKGQQAILFLNRRAYSPFIVCRDCGHRWNCTACAVSLAYHRKQGRLVCHHCGQSEPAPRTCPQCDGERVAPFGVGVEKVEEAVSTAFPEARVARLDRDIARRKGALEEVLTAFRSRETDVLVGTQMVAKGLDFPNVTLVGVVAADISLNVPDFRASEKTFQLLSQVAGRAGRGLQHGKVVVQTLSPNHVSVQAAANHDYMGFYDPVLSERQQAAYPPFVRLVNVVLSGPELDKVAAVAKDAGARLGQLTEARVLGPVDCPIERIQGHWRKHILVKLPPNADVRPVAAALEQIVPGKVKVILDVDPASML